MRSPVAKKISSIFWYSWLLQKVIKNFANIAEPLFYLLKGNNKLIWIDNCKTAFSLLKETLIIAPILAYPNYNKKFIIQTNASLTAIEGVLFQINDEGKEHPISYCSRTLNIHKRDYIVTERKYLAVIHSYKQFRV